MAANRAAMEGLDVLGRARLSKKRAATNPADKSPPSARRTSWAQAGSASERRAAEQPCLHP